MLVVTGSPLAEFGGGGERHSTGVENFDVIPEEGIHRFESLHVISVYNLHSQEDENEKIAENPVYCTFRS